MSNRWGLVSESHLISVGRYLDDHLSGFNRKIYSTISGNPESTCATVDVPRSLLPRSSLRTNYSPTYSVAATTASARQRADKTFATFHSLRPLEHTSDVFRVLPDLYPQDDEYAALYAAYATQRPLPSDLAHLAKHHVFDTPTRVLVFCPTDDAADYAAIIPRCDVPPSSGLDPTAFPVGTPLRTCLIALAHGSPTAAHRGIRSTYLRLRARYYWPSLADDATKFVRSCHLCQIAKPPNQRPYGFLKSLDIPARPWVALSMDFVTGLHPSGAEGFDSIFVVVDRFSKAARFWAVHKAGATAPVLANLLLQDVIYRNGVPNFIVSDRGSQFTSEFWRDLQANLGTVLQFSTPYHPATDGQTERVNRVLGEMLRMVAHFDPSRWSHTLRCTEYAYNSAFHASLGMSPLEAERGYSPLQPVVFERESVFSNGRDPPSQLIYLRAQHWMVRDALYVAQQRQARYYNLRRRAPDLKEGDLVLISRKAFGDLEKYDKMMALYSGPYRVDRVHANNVVELDMQAEARHPRRVNICWLRHYDQRTAFLRVPPEPPHNARTRREELARAQQFLAITGSRSQPDGTTQYYGIWDGCDPRVPAPISTAAWNSLSTARRHELETFWQQRQHYVNTASPGTFDAEVAATTTEDLEQSAVEWNFPEGPPHVVTQPDGILFERGASVTTASLYAVTTPSGL